MGPPLFIVVKGVDYFGRRRDTDVARGMRELVKSIEADPYVDGPVYGWRGRGGGTSVWPSVYHLVHSTTNCARLLLSSLARRILR